MNIIFSKCEHCIFATVRKNSKSDPSEANRSETERYLWKYYFVASLIVGMKSVIRLFARIDRKCGPF